MEKIASFPECKDIMKSVKHLKSIIFNSVFHSLFNKERALSIYLSNYIPVPA